MSPEFVGALAGLIGAVAVLTTSITALVVALRTEKAVAGVHEIVNSRATAQDDRIAELTASLTAGGVSVPPKPAPGPE